MSTPPGRINFPCYSLAPLSSCHVIVTGGGGSANTGVFNGFAICEIGYENDSYTAYEIQRYDTSPCAIMNCAVGSSHNGKKLFLAAGKDADCYIYQLKLGTKEKDQVGGGSGEPVSSAHSKSNNLRHRVPTSNGGLKSSTDPTGKDFSNKRMNDEDEAPGVVTSTEFIFEVSSLQFVQTDFGPKDPVQNCVAFSPDSRLVLTGGADGILRVWNFPEMVLKSKIEISKKEISDVDVSPDRKYIATVAKDGRCRIWNLWDGKLNSSLDLPPEDEGKFLYKRAKFGIVEDKRNTYRLFCVLNPTNYKKNKSYLQHYTGPPFALTRVAPVGETISALALSRCGKYLAIGSMTNGDVDIYISFSLQRLKHIPQAHKTFVTGLTFLPPSEDSRGSPEHDSVLANCDAAVVSISVDNQIKVHHIEKTGGISMWLAVMLIVLVLFLTFVVCSYLDI